MIAPYVDCVVPTMWSLLLVDDLGDVGVQRLHRLGQNDPKWLPNCSQMLPNRSKPFRPKWSHVIQNSSKMISKKWFQNAPKVSKFVPKFETSQKDRVGLGNVRIKTHIFNFCCIGGHP